MELNVLPEEIHKSLIATHETVEQLVFVLLHNQHVGGLKNVKNPKELLTTDSFLSAMVFLTPPPLNTGQCVFCIDSIS